MSLKKCRECSETISEKAKVCPHCGIKNPYIRKWGDNPLWLRRLTYFVALPLWAFLALVIVSSKMNEDDRLLEELSTLAEADYQKKYEGWSKLFLKHEYNQEYARNTQKYGTLYARQVPYSDVSTNLNIYKTLQKANKAENYSDKITRYETMEKVEFACLTMAKEHVLTQLKAPDSFDENWTRSGGNWINTSKYACQLNFNAQNSFGVSLNHIYTYEVGIDWKTGTTNFTLVNR